MDAEKTCFPPTCDGPAAAMLLREVVDASADVPTLENDSATNHRCCKDCRPKALLTSKVLQDMLFLVRKISRGCRLLTTMTATSKLVT
jgi:hypothetical protein